LGFAYDRTYALRKLYLPSRLIDMANVGVHATLDPEHAKKIIEGKTDKSTEK